MDVGRIQELLTAWKLPQAAVRQENEQVYEIGGRWYLKLEKDRKRMERHLRTLAALKGSLPVPEILSAKDGADCICFDGTYAFLCTKLPGTPLFYGQMNDEDFCLVGKMTAQVQQALQRLDMGLYDKEDTSAAVRAMDAVYSLPELTPYQRRLQALLREFDALYPLLPRQVIHRDCHLGNFLFEDHCLSGCIDLDQVQVNARILDPCYLLQSMLAGTSLEAEAVKRWFAHARTLLAAYYKHAKLSLTEIEALPGMFACVEMTFIAYFLDIGDWDNANLSIRLLQTWLDNLERARGMTESLAGE